MSGDQALGLVLDALRAALWVAGPVLLVALLAGILVGMAQTVLQLNESSISFVVKVIAVVGVLLVMGPFLAQKLVDYTKHSLSSIEHVVRP